MRNRIVPVAPMLRNNALSGPFPVRKSCQLVYTDLVDISLTAGAGEYLFRCNDLFDPNFTGTGTQPLYFDQLMTIYNHFVVTSSVLEFQMMGSTVTRDLLVTSYIDDDTTTTGTTTLAAQRPGAKTVSMNPGIQVAPIITMGWNAYTNFGPNVLNNELFRGNNTVSPQEVMYYVIKVSHLGLTTETLPMRVKITFNATFTELRTVAGS